MRAYTVLPPSGWVPDLAVGLAAMGLAATSWRTSRAVSALSLLLAATWWAGMIWPVALYWHRGVLVHPILSVPHWWPRLRPSVAAVAVGYLAALAAPVLQSGTGVAAWAAGLVAAGVLEARSRRRPGRHVGAVLLLGAAFVVGFLVPELLGPESGPTVAVLAYDVLLVATLGTVGLLVCSPRRTELTDLAVDLGTAPVRDVETLVRPVKAEPGLAADGDLQAALAAARRLEAANQEIRDRVREAVLEVDRSRRRLVVAASQERRRLGLELTATADASLRDLVERAARAGMDVPGLSRAGVAICDVTGRVPSRSPVDDRTPGPSDASRVLKLEPLTASWPRPFQIDAALLSDTISPSNPLSNRQPVLAVHHIR